MPDFALSVITALLYAALALHAWSNGRLAVAGMDVGGEPARREDWRNLAIPIVLILHAYGLYRSIFGHEAIQLGLGSAVSLIVWLTVLVYWLGNLHYGISALQTLVLPVAAVCVLVGGVLPAQRILDYANMPAFKVHLVISMLAYSLFTIGALHALLMAALEKRLHGGTLPPLLRGLPPLMAMETLLFRILAAGFVLLTLTVASGIFFSEALFGKPLKFSHKTVFAILAWGIFGTLLGGRWLYGWRGRVAVRWTLAGFAMLLLAYVGSKFVLEVLLGRP